MLRFQFRTSARLGSCWIYRFLTPFGEKPTYVNAIAEGYARTRIGRTVAGCRRAAWPILSDDLERRSRGSIQAKLIGKGQHIEDSEAPSYGRLSILERIQEKPMRGSKFLVVDYSR